MSARRGCVSSLWSGTERRRFGERLKASLAGVAELELLRWRHWERVQAVLGRPGDGEGDCANGDTPHHKQQVQTEQCREDSVEVSVDSRWSTVSWDALALPDSDTTSPGPSLPDPDSRPSSGFYSVSGSCLSMSCCSVCSEGISVGGLPGGGRDGRPRSADHSTPRGREARLLAAPCTHTHTERGDRRPVSTGDLEMLRGFLSLSDLFPGLGLSLGGNVVTTSSPPPTSSSTHHSHHSRGPTSFQLDAKFCSDLVSRKTREVYPYPSPLHAVALQSPLYSLWTDCTSGPGEGREEGRETEREARRETEREEEREQGMREKGREAEGESGEEGEQGEGREEAGGRAGSSSCPCGPLGCLVSSQAERYISLLLERFHSTPSPSPSPSPSPVPLPSRALDCVPLGAFGPGSGPWFRSGRRAQTAPVSLLTSVRSPSSVLSSPGVPPQEVGGGRGSASRPTSITFAMDTDTDTDATPTTSSSASSLGRGSAQEILGSPGMPGMPGMLGMLGALGWSSAGLLQEVRRDLHRIREGPGPQALPPCPPEPRPCPSLNHSQNLNPSQQPSLNLNSSLDPISSPSLDPSPSQNPSPHPSLNPSQQPNQNPCPSLYPSSPPSLNLNPSLNSNVYLSQNSRSLQPSPNQTPNQTPSPHPNPSLTPSPSLNSANPSSSPCRSPYSHSSPSLASSPPTACVSQQQYTSPSGKGGGLWGRQGGSLRGGAAGMGLYQGKHASHTLVKAATVRGGGEREERERRQERERGGQRQRGGIIPKQSFRRRLEQLFGGKDAGETEREREVERGRERDGDARFTHRPQHWCQCQGQGQGRSWRRTGLLFRSKSQGALEHRAPPPSRPPTRSHAPPPRWASAHEITDPGLGERDREREDVGGRVGGWRRKAIKKGGAVRGRGGGEEGHLVSASCLLPSPPPSPPPSRLPRSHSLRELGRRVLGSVRPLPFKTHSLRK
ncbi:uncharacterized protein LOC136764781 [Amia ocellicauda]|uniref:uncharacterized protein LOC136764781 n=1 Tax=Amia ocellicauda TaxID=2972642 RepID=UPI003464CD2A